jgi:hypothetical protein
MPPILLTVKFFPLLKQKRYNVMGRHDTKPSDIQHDDTQQNNKNDTFSITVLRIMTFHAYDECLYANCHISCVAIKSIMLILVMLSVIMLSIVILSVVMLRLVMLSVIMLSVIMLSVIMQSAIMLSVVMLSVFMLSVIMLSFFMLSVVILSVVMLSAVMLSVVMLSVVTLSAVMLTVMSPQNIRLGWKGHKCHYKEFVFLRHRQE